MDRRRFLAGAGVAALGPGVVRSRSLREALRRGVRGNVAQETYRNPVYEEVFPDPDAIRVDGTYYAYGTYHDWGEGPDRELIPVLRSPNLVDWERVGPAFREVPDWSRYVGLWAPAAARLASQFVLYYSDSEFGADDPGVGVATAAGPAGPFEPRGGLFRSEAIGVPNSIDPAVFVDDATPYLFWGSHRGIYGIELAADGLSTAGSADEKFRIAGRGVEAPYVVERGDRYYFFGSRGTCCSGADSTYHVVAARAEDLRGPYRNREGEVLTGGGTGTTILSGGDRFVGPGHCAVVRDSSGGWWLLYHAYEAGDPWIGDTPRRVLMLDRVRWEDGWPVVGDGTPSATGKVSPVDV